MATKTAKKPLYVLLPLDLFKDMQVLAQEEMLAPSAYVRRLIAKDTATKMKRRARKGSVA